MLMTKRGGDDLTRSGENKRACCGGEEENESSILGDLSLDSSGCIWSETMQEVASNLSRTVVSVVLSNGHSVLFACSGIAIESGESLSLGPRTCFLTSACLVRALDDNKTKYHDDDLKIEVRHEGNVYEGCLQQYDFDHDIAIVDVMMCLHVNGMYFGHVKSPPYSKVVAVGRDISGKLMATSGILTGDSSGSEDCEDIMLSTCKISEDWRGGPLVDLDGNFVGMNLCLVTEGTLFLPEELILERFMYFGTSLRRTKFIARLSNAVSVETMLMTKRGGDDLTRSGENKRACCGGEEENESSILGDLRLDSSGCIWSETMQEVASNLSRTVVSVVLSNGHSVLFACSGIAIESGESLSLGPRTCFLTSACLVRALDDNKTKYHDDDLKIEVRHEGNVYEGCLQQYDFDHDIALVDVMMCLHVNGMYFGDVESPPYSKIVAVGRDISGKLMATSGILTGDSSGSEDCEDIMLSTCKISEDWRGGPLVDFDGNFVGMNLCLVTEGTLFLPEELILERLGYFRTSLRRTKFIARLSNAVRNGGRPIGDISNSDPEVHRVIQEDEIIVDIDSLGYPKPSKSMLHDGMVLVNTFEEPFGDVYCEGVWSELSKKVSDNICRNVVALASFNGETRVFACTGFFIEWDGLATILTSASLVRNSVDHNKIDENLRIEVRLPNNKYRAGRLEHYNLHYNVALVSVKDFRAVRPVIFQNECCFGRPSRLVAVGRCFESGTLMASKGRRCDWSGQLDCKFLVHATCKTTKAGIGGPLVDFSGRFIGMNFYEKNIGTPSLLCNHIIVVLQSFKKKGSGKKVSSSVPFWTLDMDKDETVPPNRWPVPKPYWCHRDDLAEDISVFAPNGRMLYGYRKGKMVEYH